MDLRKLFLFSVILFLETSGHRFERHSTKNVLLDGMVVETSEINGTNYVRLPQVLVSDGVTNIQQDGDDLMLTGYGDNKVEVDKNNPKLEFELCLSFSFPQKCLDISATVCYDAEDVNELRRGSCRSGQCEFVAGVSEGSELRQLWLMAPGNTKQLPTDDSVVCISAVMKHPKAIVPYLPEPFASCNPKFYDGNMVNLSVTNFMDGCYLKVKHAKQWFPTTTPPPTTPEMPSTVPSPSETTASSTANIVWIIVGIFAGVAVLLIIGLGIWYCFCYKKKKLAVARTIEGRVVEPLPELPELKTVTEVEKLTVEDEDPGAKGRTTEEKKEVEAVKPKMETETVKLEAPPKVPALKHAKKEKKKKDKKVVALPKCPNVPPPKEEAKQPPPKPAKLEVKEEKVVVKEDPKPANLDKFEEEQKEDKTQEEPAAEDVVKKVFVKATVKDATINAAIVEQPAYPFVLVPPGVLRPFSSKLARSQYKGSLRSGKRNSLSDSEDPRMCLVVEAESRIIKKIGFGKLDKATKDQLEAEMDKFFPSSLCCTLDPRETILFCCPMNAMLAKVDKLVETAEERMTAHGCEFDEFGCMTEASDEAKEFLGKSSTPSFYRSYAFGGIYRDYIDPFVGDKQVHSIPLLFSIAMQRRYSSPNRLQALAFIRKQMPIVKYHFTAEKCRGFSFPVCAIEAAFKMNPSGFKLQEEDPTQPSRTRKAEKDSKKKTASPKRKVKLIEW